MIEDPKLVKKVPGGVGANSCLDNGHLKPFILQCLPVLSIIKRILFNKDQTTKPNQTRTRSNDYLGFGPSRPKQPGLDKL